MSKTRLLIRILLVVAICGVLWLGYRSWVRSTPDFYWTRAEKAFKEKKWQEARLNLQNLLKNHPEHVDGMRKMAEVQLEEAKASEQAEGRDLSYAEVPAALSFLALAAENAPKDLELQQQVLAAYLARGQMGDASQVAKRVLEEDPKNADALFAVAYAAVDSDRIRDAEDAFDKLRNAKSRRVFSTFALQVQMYTQDNDPEKANKALGEAIGFAKTLDVEQIQLLTMRDRRAMARLLVQAAENSDDADMAVSRVNDGLGVLETVVGGENLLPADEVAKSASRMSLVLSLKFPVQGDDSAAEEQRSLLAQRAAALSANAATEGIAEPAIYYQAAVAEFSKGGPASETKGLEILENGIKACEDIPEERRKEVLNLNLLAARRYILSRRFEDAEKHIRVLLQNEYSAGWAHLMAGAVAITEGKHEQALQQYKLAQREMGNQILIRMGLANCYLALQQWEEALPHLNELHSSLGNLDDEQKAWVERELGNEDNVHLGQLTAYLNLKEWEKATPHLEALTQTSLAEPAWSMAVAYLWRDGRRAEARTRLTELRRKYPASIRLLQSEIQMLNIVGQEERVDPLITEFAEKNPDLLVAQLLVVRQKLLNKDPQAALDKLDAIPAAIYSKPVEKRAINALRAQSLLALDRPDDALALAEALDNEQGKLIGAAVKMSQADLKGATELVGQASGRSGYLKMLEGRLLAEQGQFGSAVDAFASSLDVTSIRSAARGQVIRALLQLAAQEGPVVAEQKANELLKIYPDDTALLIAKGDFKVQQGQMDEALELFDQVEKWDPASGTGPYLKAAVWMQQREWRKAYVEAERALEINPTMASALETASRASLADRQFTRAGEIAQKGIEAHPKTWIFIQLRYQALRALEKTDEASKLLTDTIANRPEMGETYLLRASELIAAKKDAEALQVYRDGFKAAPKAFGLLSAEVGLLAKMGNIDEASAVAKKHYDGDAKTSANALALARAFLSVQKAELAVQWAKNALNDAKTDAEKVTATLFLGDLTLKQAMTEQSQADYDAARDYFQDVMKIAPKHGIAGNNLAWLLATKYDNASEAAAICDRLRGETSIKQLRPEFVDTLCEAYRRCGREDEAREIVKEMLELQPKSATFQFHWGMLLAERDKVEAVKALAAAIQAGLPAEQEAEAKRVLGKLSQ